MDAFLAELNSTRGENPHLDASLDALTRELSSGEDLELRARDLVERLATTLQASLLVRHAPSAVSDAFCAGRLGARGYEFGTLPAGLDLESILSRALPEL